MTTPDSFFDTHSTVKQFPPRASNADGAHASQLNDIADNVTPLTTFAADNFKDRPIPPREWLTEGLPAGTVGILSGNGGTGKSQIALQLAAARALRRHWLGTHCQPGSTLYLSAEDDLDEIGRRLDIIRNAERVSWEDLASIQIVDLTAEDQALASASAKSTVEATNLFMRVEQCAANARADLIILDSAADYFGGDEIARGQVRGFLALLRRLCANARCSVLLLAHPSVAGMNTGTGISGSTAWNNSVRGRLYLETTKASSNAIADPDARTLSIMKSNYGPAGQKIALRWRDGIYVRDNEASTWLDRRVLEKEAESIFLSVMELFERNGQCVSPKQNANNFAPTAIANHDMAKGMDRKHLIKAMQRLIDTGKLIIATEGPASRRIQYLRRADK